MTSFTALAKGFQPNHYLAIHTSDQTLVAIRRKKACCFSVSHSQTIQMECQAVQKALDWLKDNRPTDQQSYQDFGALYRGACGRLRAVRRVSRGFWGRFISLFRSKQSKQEIKRLEGALDDLLQTMQKGDDFAKSLFSQIQSNSSNDKTLFKQISSELPHLITSKNPTAADFGLSVENSEPKVPFLLKMDEIRGYSLFLPSFNSPHSIHLHSIRDLQGAFQSYRNKELFEQCRASSTSLDEITHPVSIREVVDKFHYTLRYDRNNPFKSEYTLVAHSYNVLTGNIDTKELLLDSTQTEESIRAWSQPLIDANLARLESVDELLNQYKDLGIEADLLTRTLHAQVDINLSRRHLKEVGLNAQAFNQLADRIHAYQANNKFYSRQWPILNKEDFFNKFSIRRCTSYIGPSQERFYQICFTPHRNAPVENLLKVKESENLEESFFREFERKFPGTWDGQKFRDEVEKRVVPQSQSRWSNKSHLTQSFDRETLTR